MITISTLSLFVWSVLMLVVGFLSMGYMLVHMGYQLMAVPCTDCGGDIGRAGVLLVSKHTSEVLCDKCLAWEAEQKTKREPGRLTMWCNHCDDITVCNVEVDAAGALHDVCTVCWTRDFKHAAVSSSAQGLSGEHTWCDPCGGFTLFGAVAGKLACSVCSSEFGTDAPSVKERETANAAPLPGVVSRSCDRDQEEK